MSEETKRPEPRLAQGREHVVATAGPRTRDIVELARTVYDVAAPVGHVGDSTLDDALQELEALSPRQGRVVELRFFAGLDVEETAEVLEISTATVKRDWAFARAFLLNALAA